MMNLRLSVADDIAIPTRMRRARKRAGMTQSQVAACVGRDTSTICTWETGKRGISYADLASFGACVHASIADLIGDDLSLGV